MGLYRLPLFWRYPSILSPPHIISSTPVHIAVESVRADGQSASVDVIAQASVVGLYRPPVFSMLNALPSYARPPHMIISSPVHTIAKSMRPEGQLKSTEVDVHESVTGL
jgi:hypothetical protein